MSIINSYDESEELVSPGIFTQGTKQLPEIAIVCFKSEIFDVAKSKYGFEEYSDFLFMGDSYKIYKSNVAEKEVILYKTLLGGPATVTIMEEIRSRGVKTFIIFGSCGTLVSNLKSGCYMIPTKAYRDEGTSYHYVQASDFIDVETSDEMIRIFEKNNIPYVSVGTWTTDALYKETKEKLNKRVEEGCQIVDMECSSVMAMAKNRDLKVYQFFYTEDTLTEEEWDGHKLSEDRTDILEECLKISFKIIEEI